MNPMTATDLNVAALANLLDANIWRVASVLGLFGVFSWRRPPKPDDVLDAEYVRTKLEQGLNDLSDADRRNTEFCSVDPTDITLDDASLARRIADALSKKKGK